MGSLYRSYSGSLNTPSARQKTKALVQSRIRETMVTVASDVPLLMEVVAGGPNHWRGIMTKAFAPHPVGELPDILFRFFSAKVLELHAQEQSREDAQRIIGSLDMGLARYIAKDTMDHLEVTKPLTEAEKAASWEIDDSSSEEGRRMLYGDLHPKEYLDRLIAEDLSKLH